MRRLNVVQYVGEHYLLTDWIITGGIRKRVWVSNVGSQNAVVIMGDDPIKIVLYTPDGGVLDVNATRSHKESLRIARAMLEVFYSDAKIVVTLSVMVCYFHMSGMFNRLLFAWPVDDGAGRVSRSFSMTITKP